MLIASCIDGIFVRSVDDRQGNSLLLRSFGVLKQILVYVVPIIRAIPFVDLPFVATGIERISDLLNVCQLAPAFGICTKHPSTGDFFQEWIVVANVANIPLLREHHNVIKIFMLRPKVS